MSAKVFVIADTHFGHKSVIGYTSRGKFARTIEEHDQLLIDNWNEEVGHDDTVYLLGDVAWTKADAFATLPQLNGNKRLVGGNHDVWAWVKHDFLKFNGAKELERGKHKVVLTHIPIHPQELYTPIRRWDLNIHGHLHDNVVLDHTGRPDWNYACVSCEQVGMRPVELDAVIEMAMARRG